MRNVIILFIMVTFLSVSMLYGQTDEEVSVEKALIDVSENEPLFRICLSEKYGFINKTGELVIKPQFTWADDFIDGLARVLIGDYETGKWGYINKKDELNQLAETIENLYRRK
jgi:hypothetical protein